MEHPRSSTGPLRRHAVQGRARVPGALPATSRAYVHDGVTFMHVSSEWDHDKFRLYVLRAALRAHVAEDRAGIAAVTGIDSGLLGRYFRGEVQPGEKNLEKIAAAIPGTTMKDLRILSGRAKPQEYEQSDGPEMPIVAHHWARLVDRLLGDTSPLPPAEREVLDTMLGRILSPYEDQMSRQRRQAC